jgi:DNA-binding transcriptional ArsR family regulator
MMAGMAHPQAPRLAALAALLADETRATFCVALLDGRAWTASELARAAQVSRPTATGHLNRLVEGSLLAEVRQGRHCYLKLADDRTAHLIEEPWFPAPDREVRFPPDFQVGTGDAEGMTVHRARSRSAGTSPHPVAKFGEPGTGPSAWAGAARHGRRGCRPA